MSNIIDKIQLSGVTYDIGGQGGSGVSVVEVTQAEYDALPSSAKTDTSKMYVITDAEAGDLTNYYTKTETNTLLGGKQDTLVSGTNIKTINNTSILGSGNIDIQGGGGKAVEAGRGISVASGDSAYTVSFDLDIYNHTGSTIAPNIEIFGHPYADKGISTNKIKNNSMYEFIVGDDNRISGSGKVTYGTIIGENNKIISDGNNTRPAYIFGIGNVLSGINLGGSTLIGEYNSGYTYYEFAAGYANECKNQAEVALGKYNVSSSATTSMEFGDSGNTLFSVGNGTSSARHNAFEIRQNGDIYYFDGTNDVKLQDVLDSKQTTLTAGTGISIIDNVISATGGGGGGTVESAITSGSTNAVESKTIWSATTYNKDVLLTFNGYNSTNYPSGCTKIKVEVVGSNNLTNINFFNDGNNIGSVTINNWGSISVDNHFQGATYEISGTTVIISYPTVTNVTKINVSNNGNYVYKAVVEGVWIADNTYMKSEVDAIQNTLQNSINQKLDSTAYTPVNVDSALIENSTNPVEGGVLYDELVYKGAASETTLTFDERQYSTNYPEGCTQIKVEVAGSMNNSTIEFYNDWDRLGNININNYGSISVNNSFEGATYEISGTTVIISYPTVQNVTKNYVYGNGNYVFKAVTYGASTTVKDHIAANTTALGGLKLVKLSQSEYDALAAKNSNTLYVIVN